MSEENLLTCLLPLDESRGWDSNPQTQLIRLMLYQCLLVLFENTALGARDSNPQRLTSQASVSASCTNSQYVKDEG